MKTALVLGAGGFIGTHLVRRLKSEGYWVRGVDLKYPEYSQSEADEMLIYDLRDSRNVEAVMRLDYWIDSNQKPTPRFFEFSEPPFSNKLPFDEVYQLAADMGGAGYIFTGDHDADIMHNSGMINLNVAYWGTNYKVGTLFYSSSACIYPSQIQESTENSGLKESDAWPANPDSRYGVEKLSSEQLYLAFADNYGLNVRIARFHNIYGEESAYEGGRDKAPAAMCRKVIEAKIAHDKEALDPIVSIWGDGNQTRSFLYIDDCCDAVRLLMKSNFNQPINIGSEEMVSINHLVQIAIDFSKLNVEIVHDLSSKALGVRGRNSNNDLIKDVLGWEPKYTLRQGMEKTYKWIEEQMRKK